MRCSKVCRKINMFRLSVLLQLFCLRNIRAFLHSCKDAFGLKDTELFDECDLFDVKDFGKVCQIKNLHI